MYKAYVKYINQIVKSLNIKDCFDNLCLFVPSKILISSVLHETKNRGTLYNFSIFENSEINHKLGLYQSINID